jgi:hypothetical protein
MKEDMILIKIIVSEPKRPYIPDYGISEKKLGLVSWDDVNRWMEKSQNYWINTIRGNFPHSRPIWGIWYENVFYFGGVPQQETLRIYFKTTISLFILKVGRMW